MLYQRRDLLVMLLPAIMEGFASTVSSSTNLDSSVAFEIVDHDCDDVEAGSILNPECGASSPAASQTTQYVTNDISTSVKRCTTYDRSPEGIVQSMTLDLDQIQLDRALMTMHPGRYILLVPDFSTITVSQLKDLTAIIVVDGPDVLNSLRATHGLAPQNTADQDIIS